MGEDSLSQQRHTLNNVPEITFVDLLCYIRKQIIEGRAEQDQLQLNKIMCTLSIIDDAIVEINDPTYYELVDDLENALRNSFIAEYKVEIPTEEAIRAASGRRINKT